MSRFSDLLASKGLVHLWFYKVFGPSKAKLYLGLKLNMGQMCSRRSASVLEESSQEALEERYSSASASIKKRIKEYQA